MQAFALNYESFYNFTMEVYSFITNKFIFAWIHLHILLLFERPLPSLPPPPPPTSPPTAHSGASHGGTHHPAARRVVVRMMDSLQQRPITGSKLPIGLLLC